MPLLEADSVAAAAQEHAAASPHLGLVQRAHTPPAV